MSDSTAFQPGQPDPAGNPSDPRPFRFPFANLAAPVRRRAFVAFALASTGVSMLLAAVGAPLTVPAAPGGIVTFEFAGGVAEAQRIMTAWGAAGVAAAWTQTWLDFAYLAMYGPCLALACGLVVGPWARRSVGIGRLGVALSWGALAAAAFDAVENVALLAHLAGSGSDVAAGVAWGAAAVKFTLILAALAYALLGAALWAAQFVLRRQ